MHDLIHSIVQQIKIQNPLILNITNYVTMEFVANGLLSLGCSPLMSNSSAELAELMTIVDAVVINIGTLNDEFIHLCEVGCVLANQLNKPLILDPVGAGASQYRTSACLNWIERYQFSIIRGNASEILALCGQNHNTKGVDATDTTLNAIESAQLYSSNHNLVLAISGELDAVIHGSNVSVLKGGSALMPLVSGTGCLLTAVISAFQVINKTEMVSAAAAITFYNQCAERASLKARGPGSFKMHFLDELARYSMRNNDAT